MNSRRLIASPIARDYGTNPHVRYGSKADIGLPPAHVRYTPKSGHQAFVSTRPSITLYDGLHPHFSAAYHFRRQVQAGPQLLFRPALDLTP
jgi:hypothetical protein